MTRARRLLLITVVVLGVVVVVVVGFFIGRWFLGSRYLASRVAAQLETAYGGPVEVDAINVGFGGSELHGLRLFEGGSSSAPQAWISARDVQTDFSIWSYLSGVAIPKEVTLSAATVRLQLDKAGKLKTRFPGRQGKTNAANKAGAFPQVHIHEGNLILDQDDRPRLELSGIDADLDSAGEQLTVKGTVHDPLWGDWDLSGSLASATGAVSISLKTTRPVHVTRAMLDRLPYVPNSVWETVRIEKGTTPAEVTLHYDPAKKALSYQVVVTPTHTSLAIPVIDLKATESTGKVDIKDGLVRLRDVHGQAIDGNLFTDADLDFRGPETRLDFKQVKVQGVQVADLPKKWKFPLKLKGKLSGEAHLLFRLAGGKVRTSGAGKGVITDTNLGGTLHIELHSGPEGFRFDHKPAAGKAVGRGPQDTRTRTDLALGEGKARRKIGPVFHTAKKAAPTTEKPTVSGRVVGAGAEAGAGLVHALTRSVLAGGIRLLKSIPDKVDTKPVPKSTKPRYMETSLSMDDVDLAQFVRGLGMTIPFPVAGRFSFQVQLSIPLDTPSDLKTYRAQGTVTASRLALADFQFEQVRARAAYTGGMLRLHELSARLPPPARPSGAASLPATLRGSAALQLVPLGDVSANVNLSNIPLAVVMKGIPAGMGKPDGTFTGSVQVKAPARRLSVVAAWEATGTIAADKLQVLGLHFTDLATNVLLQRGKLSLEEARVKVEGAPLRGAVDLSLAQPYAYSGKVELRDWDLAALARLDPSFRPPVTLAGTFQTAVDVKGALSPLTFRLSGTGSAANLKVAGVQLQSFKFRLAGAADRLTFSELHARLYDGDVSGSAVVPLRNTLPGSITLRFQQLDVGALARALPKNPLKVLGKADGTIKGTLTAASKNKPRSFSLQLSMAAARLAIQGIPTDQVEGTVGYEEGGIIYHLQGKSLGGRFHLKGKVPLSGKRPAGARVPNAPQRPKQNPGQGKPENAAGLIGRLPVAAAEPPDGRLQLEGIHLRRVWEALGIQPALGPLRGRGDLDVTFRHEFPDWALVGSGRFELTNLRWNGTDLAGTVRSDVKLNRTEVRFSNLSGNLGGGLLSGQLALKLKQLGEGWFNLGLSRVESSRLFAPWPALGSLVRGPIEARLRGTLGAEWSATARIHMAQGRVAGLEVSDWHLPLDLFFAPKRARGHLNVHSSRGHVAHGRATLRTSLSWGMNSRVEGEVQFTGVNLRTLLEEFGTHSQVGSGLLTGRLEFAGNDIQSVADMTATLDANLSKAQALQMPVLRQLVPFLRGGQSPATTFDTGRIHATLSRDVIQVKRLTLSGNLLRLIVQGTVNLDGRLALEATATAGRSGPSARVSRLLRTRVPVVGTVSARLLRQATTLLARELVHIRISGTVHNPSIRIEPLYLLTAEATRFFAGR